MSLKPHCALPVSEPSKAYAASYGLMVTSLWRQLQRFSVLWASQSATWMKSAKPDNLGMKTYASPSQVTLGGRQWSK